MSLPRNACAHYSRYQAMTDQVQQAEQSLATTIPEALWPFVANSVGKKPDGKLHSASVQQNRLQFARAHAQFRTHQRSPLN